MRTLWPQSRGACGIAPTSLGARPQLSAQKPSGHSPEHSRSLLATAHAVALVLGGASTTVDGYPRILEAIGTSLGWQFGAVWEPAPDAPAALRCVETWTSDNERTAQFAEVSRATTLPVDRGLP